MTISILRFVIAVAFIIIGVTVMVIQTLGVFRIHYVLNRMHVAAMGDSLGYLMVMTGVLIIYGFSFASLKVFAMLCVFWLASPVAAHLVSKVEVTTNENIEEECEVEEK